MLQFISSWMQSHDVTAQTILRFGPSINRMCWPFPSLTSLLTWDLCTSMICFIRFCLWLFFHSYILFIFKIALTFHDYFKYIMIRKSFIATWDNMIYIKLFVLVTFLKGFCKQNVIIQQYVTSLNSITFGIAIQL